MRISWSWLVAAALSHSACTDVADCTRYRTPVTVSGSGRVLAPDGGPLDQLTFACPPGPDAGLVFTTDAGGAFTLEIVVPACDLTNDCPSPCAQSRCGYVTVSGVGVAPSSVPLSSLADAGITLGLTPP